MREYTLAAAGAVVAVVVLELAVLRTGMFRARRYWATIAVVMAFQLLVNGVLACTPIVTYDPRRILGPRLVCAPVEDLGFGFAMVTATIGLWRRAASRG